ncbi:hypothetical protein K431DRAFT_131585 [Polychaeton citri CBS 116435]|uniref:Uncharacterized protein n=1 Tax=Polychaeton citri CBS 116435 TaxID=1314669 RepID=A0A9P4QE25_9PEZI|nr:hypothetical protein K431DRAFT_131585 [Polychaeton citri CBS 116435]
MGNKPDQERQNVTWVTFNPAVNAGSNNRRTYASNEERRRDVRSAAAKASAAARKATIARKEREKQLGCASPTDSRPRPRKRPSAKRLASAEHASELKNVDQCQQITADSSISSDVFETMLWSSILTNCDLHYTAMLLTATPSNYCAIDHPKHVGAGRACIISLRGSALRSIYQLSGTALNTRKAHGSFSAAIAVMAGWEQMYGDPKWYELHMKAWRDIVKPQQGASWEREHAAGMADRVIEVIRKRYSWLAAQTQGTRGLLLAEGEDSMRTRAEEVLLATPFDLGRPEARVLVHISTKLLNYNPTAPNSMSAMHEMGILLLMWRPQRGLPADWAAAGLDPELIEDLALYHVRAALIAVGAAWSLLHSMATGNKLFMDVLDTIDEHFRETRPLRTEVLLGTKYEEIALWTRFTLTAKARPHFWDGRSIEILRQLIIRQDIQCWEDLDALLKRYPYVQPVYEDCSRELYQVLVANNPVKCEMDTDISEAMRWQTQTTCTVYESDLIM